MALEVAINELRNTVDQARLYHRDTDTEKLATIHRSYIADIVEDIGLLERHRASFKEKETEVAELIAEARRLKRDMERAAYTLEAAAKKVPANPTVSVSKSSSNIKLPRIKLPIFDGERTEDYRGFMDAFLDAVDSEPDLGEVKKWLLLKAQLTGKAFSLIKELPTAPETYAVAHKILEDAYGSAKRAVLKLYQRLHQLPTAEMSTDGLRVTHAQMEGILLSLSSLGVSLDQDDFLRAVVIGKYPVELVHTLRVTDEMPLLRFRQEVNDYIKLRDCTIQPAATAKADSDGAGTKGGADGFQKKQPKHVKSNPSSSGGCPTGSAPPHQVTDKPTPKPKNKPERVKSCAFCLGAHWSDECTVHGNLEERSKLVADKCQRCLKPRHADGNCGSKRVCFYCKDAEHNSALCPKQFAKVLLTEVKSTETSKCCRFITAILPLGNASRSRMADARVLFDTAGGRSLITADLAAELQLGTAGTERVRLVGVNGAPLSGEPACSRRLFLHPPGAKPVEVSVFVVPRIVDNVVATEVAEVKRLYPRYAALPMPAEGNGQPVRLLLGYRALTAVVTLQRSIALGDNLQLMSTSFGWVPFGGLPSEAPERLDSSIVGLLAEDPVRLMSDLELIGLGDFLRTSDEEELVAMEKFNASIRRVGKRYEVSWPYRYTEPELEDNFGLAYGRLVSLHKQLVKKPSMLEAYDRLIREQLESGVVETVNFGEKGAPGLVHYLPHRAVIRVGKSTPLRVVFDAAARSDKTSRSLNDVILKGGNWVTEIPEVLLRFRKYGVAVTCDIEKAFHQIAIASGDRDVVRFLWLRDARRPPSRENLCVYRFRRMAFGVVASPFLLTATIRHHLRRFPNEFAARIEKDLYADNLITSLPRSVDAAHYYRVVKSCFNEMSMNISQWATDCAGLRGQIAEEDRVVADPQMVLGLEWRVAARELRVRSPQLAPAESTAFTKKQVLRELASLYDPLGWMAPVALLGRLFLRKVWRAAYAWEKTLADELSVEWCALREEFGRVNEIAFERAYDVDGLEGAEAISLHTFCDASAGAYGMALYLCVRKKNRSWFGLIAAKTRLAPKGDLSIPRLELLAAVTACRYALYVERALQMEQPITKYLWGDSRCVIAWTVTEKILPAVITRAVKEIRAAGMERFLYVPTMENPADVVSRGASVERLRSENWWRGPAWLSEEAVWPQQRRTYTEEEERDQEVVASGVAAEEEARILLFECLLQAKARADPTSFEGSPFGINPAAVSSFGALLRRTAYCFRAAGRFLRGRGSIAPEEPLNYARARSTWLVWDQARNYEPAESNETNVSYLRNLRVFTDADGVMRCHTRLRHARVARDEIEPALLVKRSMITRLIVLSLHCNNHHAGTAHTLAALRRRYWLPHGRREVYQVIRDHCFVCRRAEAKPYRAPAMAPLPEFRINRTETPFANTGMDVFGPFEVHTEGERSTPTEKRWGIIFTCLVVRAVHLEMLRDMTPAEFLNSLRRFVGRRGTPRMLVCDNAPAYYVVEGQFKDVWRCFAEADPNEKYFAQHEIKWHFITPEAPWMGGAYERLIGEVKSAFGKVYGGKRLREVQLELALIEIEGVLNSRPITYVDKDSETELITPNDFLGVRYPAMPLDFTKPMAGSQLMLTWRAGTEFLEQFWRVWASGYLRDLRERRDSMRTARTDGDCVPRQGELVLMLDPTMKRSAWRLAVVERLITSEDGKVRSVQIRTGNRARLIRAVTKLAPLRLLADLPEDLGDLSADRRNVVVSEEGGEILT